MTGAVGDAGIETDAVPHVPEGRVTRQAVVVEIERIRVAEDGVSRGHGEARFGAHEGEPEQVLGVGAEVQAVAVVVSPSHRWSSRR